HFAGTDLTTVIGGTAPADRNLISGNSSGIFTASPGLTIQGNLIGTDPTGLLALGNMGYAISCASITNPGATIGGSAAGAGNVISGNHFGIEIHPTTLAHISANVVQGNRIGVNAAGTGPLGNDVGIGLDGWGSTIGGTSPGEGNVIAFNGIGVYLS